MLQVTGISQFLGEIGKFSCDEIRKNMFNLAKQILQNFSKLFINEKFKEISTDINLIRATTNYLSGMLRLDKNKLSRVE